MNIVEKKFVVDILAAWRGELLLLKRIVEFSMSVLEETEKAVERVFPDSKVDGADAYALDPNRGEEIPTYPEPGSGS